MAHATRGACDHDVRFVMCGWMREGGRKGRENGEKSGRGGGTHLDRRGQGLGLTRLCDDKHPPIAPLLPHLLDARGQVFCTELFMVEKLKKAVTAVPCEVEENRAVPVRVQPLRCGRALGVPTGEPVWVSREPCEYAVL